MHTYVHVCMYVCMYECPYVYRCLPSYLPACLRAQTLHYVCYIPTYRLSTLPPLTSWPLCSSHFKAKVAGVIPSLAAASNCCLFSYGRAWA